MAALGVSVLFFFCWLILGYPVAYLQGRRNLLQAALLAPVCGVAVVLLPVFWLSRIGSLPVNRFAALLTAALILGSAAVWVWLKPRFSVSQYRIVAVILAGALIASGWPMILHGFGWMAYVNGDMAFYSLAAERLLHHSFFEPPDMTAVLQGKDFTTGSWFLHVVVAHRAGADFMLAWASAVTGLTPHEVYMPLLLSFHLTLISTSAALVCQGKKLRTAALVTCVLAGLSAMATRGVLSQLIPQVLGIACLAGTFCVLAHDGERSLRSGLRKAAVGAILFSALAITYNEVIPFLLLSIGIYWRLAAWRGQWPPSRNAIVATCGALVFMMCLLNVYVVDFVRYMTSVAISVGTAAWTQGPRESALFPYFLMPTGLANFWGILAVTRNPGEPFVSLAIFLGGALTLLAALPALVEARRCVPVAVMTVCMLMVGLYLFFNNNDFPTFKLAMYIQPFILGSVAVYLCRLNRPRVLAACAALVALCQVHGQLSYVFQSAGSGVAEGGVSAPFVTVDQVLSQFRAVLGTIPPSRAIAVDTDSIVIGDLQNLYLRGRASNFLSFGGWGLRNVFQPGPEVNSDVAVIARRLYSQAIGGVKELKFEFNGPIVFGKTLSASADSVFVNPNAPDEVDEPVLISMPKGTIFNRFHQRQGGALVTAKPWRELSNHLVFINSRLSTTWAVGNWDLIGVNRLEADFAHRNGTMAALGRYSLFRVVHPSEPFRLIFDLTTSGINPEAGSQLPKVTIIGAERWTFPLVGSGAARVLSPPLRAQVIDGVHYVAIDMGPGWSFPNRRTGLMLLYGRRYMDDPRKITAFGRGLSAISEEQYGRLQIPIRISRFPDDLAANPDMEFSGIWEDGWIGGSSEVTLRQPVTSAPLVIRGAIPKIDDGNFHTSAAVMLNGQIALQRDLGVGEFELNVPAAACGARCRIDVNFSRTQRLPGGDRRPVAAQLKFIGFSRLPARRQSMNHIRQFPDDLHDHRRLEISGIDEDGWLRGSSSVRLRKSVENDAFPIRGSIPKIDRADFKKPVTTKVNGRAVVERSLGPGEFDLSVPAARCGSTCLAEVTFSNTRVLPGSDRRSVGARAALPGFGAEDAGKTAGPKTHSATGKQTSEGEE